MIIIVLGSQGSGKTTHAHYIAKKLGLQYLSTGDLLRKLMEEPTEIGRKVKELMHNGYIVPDDITIGELKKYFQKKRLDNDFVIEGFPRTLYQLEKFPLKVDIVFEFILDEPTAISRLKKRGRHDDSEQAIKRRLALFKEKTLPVITRFKEMGVKVFVVDNSPSIKEVQKKIDDLLKN